ncbi:MAG: carbamate kinase [Candidatus Sumerlaeota bacterium]|nr:carbamate kinase [Candidatus Sumerlaeota bacterium]
MNPRMIVVALGGNAISVKDEEGNIAQQFARTRETARHLAELIVQGHDLIVTHGNGPQVGNVLRRVELSAAEVYPIPLHLCVANTQAGMGFMIAQCLNNELRRRGKERITASTIITAVEVDPSDPAFAKPTKPIGKYLKKEEALLLKEQHGWPMQEFDNEEYRLVVPSPIPRRILPIEMIKRLVDEHELLVCCGGGGIPVWCDAAGEETGVDCVIDKDRTSALLATELGLGRFVIATAVEKVMLAYRTPRQRPLDRLTIAEARAYLDAGEFPAGTMGPKIEAAIDFLERTPHPSPVAIITNLENISGALAGTTGTHLVRA